MSQNVTPHRPTIYVDADACPVKEEVYKVAGRQDLPVIVVSNGGIRPPKIPTVRLVVVASDRLDAADDWIAEAIRPGDICVTADVPLAARCVAAGAWAVSPTGTVFDSVSIGNQLATRDLMTHLRESGAIQGGGRPLSRQDKSRFLQSLDRIVSQATRGG